MSSESHRDRAPLPVLAIVTIALLAVAGIAAARAAAPVAGPAARGRTVRAATASSPASARAAITTPTASKSPTLTVTAVGDLLFDFSVANVVASRGGTAPLKRVAPLLRKADVTIGNLESPMSYRGTRAAWKDVTLRASPKAVYGLKASGFDLLDQANNHAMDYGTVALSDTIKLLDKHKIAHAGAGMNAKKAWQPAVIVRNGKRIAYFGFTDIVPPGFAAGTNRAGVATGLNMRKVKAAIRAAKKRNDYVIVSFHWGIERSNQLTSQQIRDAHACIDAGADLVLSHHPHVMQAVEVYKGKFIAYSLGNFVFNHFMNEAHDTFIAQMKMGPKGTREIVLVPVRIDNQGLPYIAKGAQANRILGKLKRYSAKRGTKLVIKGGVARVGR